MAKNEFVHVFALSINLEGQTVETSCCDIDQYHRFILEKLEISMVCKDAQRKILQSRIIDGGNMLEISSNSFQFTIGKIFDIKMRPGHEILNNSRIVFEFKNTSNHMIEIEVRAHGLKRPIKI